MKYVENDGLENCRNFPVEKQSTVRSYPDEQPAASIGKRKKPNLIIIP